MTHHHLLKIVFSLLACTNLYAAKTKVACVGDSITYGATIPDREKLCYPAQLGYLLGDQYEVKNFGVNGATMLNKGDIPYSKQPALKKSKQFQPDIVIIKLGTNDSKTHNWQHAADFKSDAKSLVETYKKLPSHPRVIICKPVVVTREGGITEKNTRGAIAPLIAKVAYETNTEILDLHPILLDQKGWLPDAVHPNAFGAERIARTLREYITIPREASSKKYKSLKGKKSEFYGFQSFNFQAANASCKIVRPKVAAKGSPWIWRARFWAHQPQFDIAMLERGYHIVYCEVGALFGASDAVNRWDEFYKVALQYGLHKKVVLEGMSRGGLIIHNWAVANPEKVAGIIGDNPVMDFKSWPAGFGTSKGSASDWEKCKKVYGFKSDDQAKAYKLNPVDTVAQLVAKNVPILYLVGDQDKVVPGNENGLLAAKQHKDIQLITKAGKGHHPHSLPNPSPIVDFALQCYGLYQNPAALAAPSAEYRGGSAGWGGGIWWNQHENICKIAKKNKDLDVIFFGDSITQSWTGPHQRLSKPDGNRTFDKAFGKKWKSASYGISGDRTEHLLFRLRNGNFEGLKPKAIVLMIGVNNILTANHNSTQISKGISVLCAQLRTTLPDTKIILLGPFPSGKNTDEPRRKTIREVHQSIEKLGLNKQIFYHDLTPHFTNEDGSLKTKAYSGDMIHLNDTGYQIWADYLTPILEKMIK